ncbi:MAG: hypothetical protein N3D73_00645 [Candidatus Diapherotrites archaeon]|nr:hypothetical protein [Candidatus Diapherotrites archaeon]
MIGSVNLLLVFLYGVLGAGLKIIDNAFDKNSFSKNKAILIALLLSLIWVYAMMISEISATILLSILLGSFLAGKVDNIAHFLGFISTIFLLLFFSNFNIQFYLLPILLFAAIVDEFGNDLVDMIKNKKNYFLLSIYYFFRYRAVLKFTILFLVLFGYFSFEYFLAIIFFDVCYDLMGGFT